MQNEPAVPAFASNLGPRKIAGDFQNALETAVGYLELVIAPAFGYDGIASHPAHYQLVIRYYHLDVVRLDSRKIELDLPSFRAPVNIDCGLPQQAARASILAAHSLDEKSLAS
jgi:hypothetical protein